MTSAEPLTLLMLCTWLDMITKAQGARVSLRAHEGIEHRTCLIHAWGDLSLKKPYGSRIIHAIHSRNHAGLLIVK